MELPSSLDLLAPGCSARIAQVREHAAMPQFHQRLVEMGFDTGVEVEMLHHGPFGGDPVCVRVGNTQIALRRAEAALVAIEFVGAGL